MRYKRRTSGPRRTKEDTWNDCKNDSNIDKDPMIHILTMDLISTFSYLTTGVYRGEHKVHLRRYDENGYPTKKGIALNPIQVKTLLDCLDSISDDADLIFAMLKDGDKFEYSIHLGYGAYITCERFNGRKYYDVRLYWIPPNCDTKSAVPTTKGVKLREDEFGLLKGQSDILYMIMPELGEISDCTCMVGGNQLEFLTCGRCNPFDCVNWF